MHSVCGERADMFTRELIGSLMPQGGPWKPVERLSEDDFSHPQASMHEHLTSFETCQLNVSPQRRVHFLIPTVCRRARSVSVWPFLG